MTGGAAFVQDLRLPGMLHGRVARPPRYGSKLESFDEAKIKAMPGVVTVVRDGSFLGVVAQREEQAIKSRWWRSPPRRSGREDPSCPIPPAFMSN
jgi:CO/xanthine dehydrogenase Mo-binding subunit